MTRSSPKKFTVFRLYLMRLKEIINARMMLKSSFLWKKLNSFLKLHVHSKLNPIEKRQKNCNLFGYFSVNQNHQQSKVDVQ